MSKVTAYNVIVTILLVIALALLGYNLNKEVPVQTIQFNTTNLVEINHTIEINTTQVVEKINPQHFVVVRNITTDHYYSFCNTSTNLSSLDINDLHIVEIGNTTTIEGRQVTALTFNSETKKAWLVIDGKNKIIDEGNMVHFTDSNMYFMLRDVYVSNIPKPRAWIFIEVFK